VCGYDSIFNNPQAMILCAAGTYLMLLLLLLGDASE
jgi:hypothetical protein